MRICQGPVNKTCKIMPVMIQYLFGGKVMLTPLSYQMLYNKCKDPTVTGYSTHSYAHVASRLIMRTRPKVTSIGWGLYPWPGLLMLTTTSYTGRSF